MPVITALSWGNYPVAPTEGNIHNFNCYAYANNNPGRYIDPDGRAAVPSQDLGASLLGSVFSKIGGLFKASKVTNSGASSAKQAANLKEYLRQADKYGKGGRAIALK